MIIAGNILDFNSNSFIKGIIEVENGKINNIRKCKVNSEKYILPGLIDSHVHIESSMLTPTQFSKLVVPRGTVAVISDPHEIANILGIEGVLYMVNDSKNTPLKCFFGAPSCVPATSFETNGAKISVNDIENLLGRDDIFFLSEMMNYPGVINGNEEILSKISVAQKYNKRIDGHAPGLIGNDLKKYISSGISTDHECINIEEAIRKIKLGMMIQIREGSAAKNFDNLSSLIKSYPDNIMFCTDDSHPDELLSMGHIDKIIRKGIKKGYDLISLIRVATYNPVLHYQLPIGLLREGDPADFIVVDDISEFNITETYINGVNVYKEGKLNFSVSTSKVLNSFNVGTITNIDIEVECANKKDVRVIVPMDGELITDEYIWSPKVIDGKIISSIDDDILKIVVVNRYKRSKPVVGFIKNFGFKNGAIASCIAHDSHNIIAVGVNDHEIVDVINKIILNKGGIAVCSNGNIDCLELEIAGIMTSKDGSEVAEKYEELNKEVREMGCKLKSPFMTLSFMSLLVIPKLKIGDKGLFNVSNFNFTSLLI